MSQSFPSSGADLGGTAMNLRLGGLFFPVVVAALTWYAVRLLRRARRSTSWPMVAALVLDARVVRNGKNGFAPRIDYAYSVAGRQFKSRRRAVGGVSGMMAMSRATAERIVAAAPKGSTVMVAVDPDDPAYSLLEPGARKMHYFLVGMAAVLAVAAFAGFAVVAFLAQR